MKQPSFLKSPFTVGLKTACSVLVLTAFLATGGVQAADQGPRHHARGPYDTVTATYVVVEGDDLFAIGERFATLKPRERAVFEQVVAGRLNKQIADALGISERTVKLERAQVMAKLGVASSAELGRLAERLRHLGG